MISRYRQCTIYTNQYDTDLYTLYIDFIMLSVYNNIKEIRNQEADLSVAEYQLRGE